MIIHYKESFANYEIHFQRELTYMDNFSFVPVNITEKGGKTPHIFQTPLLFSPYGIQTRPNQKHSLDLSFMNKSKDKTLVKFCENLQKIFKIVQKHYGKEYHVNPFLKQTAFGDCLRLKVNGKLAIFDQTKSPIDTISSFSYGWFLINLHGLWISEKELWFQWYLVQAKIYEPIHAQEYLFIDEESDPPFDSQSKSPNKVDDKYAKMLKMGVPKEAVDRQRALDLAQVPVRVQTPQRIPPPPPPPMTPSSGGSSNSTGKAPSVQKITSNDLKSVVLKKSEERVLGPAIDRDMGYFEPPSLSDIQGMLKKLKPISQS